MDPNSGEPGAPRGVESRVRAPEDRDGDPLVALRAGDPAPFERFVAAETPHLLAYFLHLGAARAEAEDLVQDTLLKVFQSAQHYRPDGRFRGYAYRVARNAWFDRARRQHRAPRRATVGGPGVDAGEALDELADLDSAHPGHALAAREEGERIARALAALPEGQRAAFELGVVRELPYEDVAAALEIPVGTVKSRVFHAVRRLRELLAEEPPRTAPATVRRPGIEGGRA